MVQKLSVFILFLSLSAALATGVQGATGPAAAEEIRLVLASNSLTLADLFRLAEMTNPTLAAAQNGANAKAGIARQVGLYPNPTIGFGVGEMSTGDRDDRKDKLSLVQPLVLGGRRGAAVAAAQAKWDASVQDSNSKRRDIFWRIHTLYAEQLYFREAKKEYDDLLKVANTTLEIAQIRFDARAAPESQVTKALLEVYGIEIAQRQMEQDQAVGSSELLSLFWGVDVPIDRLTGTLGVGGFSASEIPDDAGMENHPAIQAAQREIDAAAASLREAKAARIPDLDLHVAYGVNRASREGFVEAGVSLPLPIFNRNQGQIAASQFQVAQAQDLARIARNGLKTTLAAASQQFQTTADQLQATETLILPAAEKGLAQTREGYRAGHLPFLELIDAQRTLSATRLRALALRRDLVIAEAKLMSLMGTGPYGEQEKYND